MANPPEDDRQDPAASDRPERQLAISRTREARDVRTTASEGDVPVETMLSDAPPAGPSLSTIPAPAPANVSAEGSVIGGKYELVRQIAQGGMGKIFLARHRELRMSVAVKIMHSHIALNSEHVERFRREALAASSLGHPNIVKVIDFGRLDPTYYIVMEYVDGVRLGDWLDTCTAVPPLGKVLPILVQTLDALICAHNAGIVHRDLKPDNILLVKDTSGNELVKIVDFGLARFRDPLANEVTITQPDAVAGTPGYMSPEQCRSLRVTQSTDLYAFGCILTEMLQLEPPFVGESVMDVISKHMFSPVPPLRRPADAEPVPPGLERLRRGLLAKAPTQRPANAGIVRERLLQSLHTDDIGERDVRASHVDQGDRAGRLPEWNQQTPTSTVPAPGAASEVEYRRFGDGESAVESLCLVGLSALGFRVHEGMLGESIGQGHVVLVDAGNDGQVAIAATKNLRAGNPDAKLIVCMLGLTTAIINDLIEAGADDVVRAPTSSDQLSRKVERLGRRRSPERGPA